MLKLLQAFYSGCLPSLDYFCPELLSLKTVAQLQPHSWRGKPTCFDLQPCFFLNRLTLGFILLIKKIPSCARMQKQKFSNILAAFKKHVLMVSYRKSFINTFQVSLSIIANYSLPSMHQNVLETRSHEVVVACFYYCGLLLFSGSSCVVICCQKCPQWLSYLIHSADLCLFTFPSSLFNI